MATLLPIPILPFFDANGLPLAGGKLYSYQAGTSTLAATYTDQTQITQNTNPLILDANGQAEVWIGSSSYKFVLKDASDVVQWTVDNVNAIDNGSVTTIKMVDGSITTAKLADGSVTTVKLADGNVTNAKILDGAITGAKIPDSSIAQAKLVTQPDSSTIEIVANVLRVKDAGISNAKILDGAVSKPKLAALGQQVSATCASATTSSTSFVDVSNLSISITTTGRPVMLMLVPDGTTSQGFLSTVNGGSGSFQILRGATSIGVFAMPSAAATTQAITYPLSNVFTVDTPAAGTYTYKVQFKGTSLGGSVTLNCNNAKLVAFEL